MQLSLKMLPYLEKIYDRSSKTQLKQLEREVYKAIMKSNIIYWTNKCYKYTKVKERTFAVNTAGLLYYS